MTRIFPVVVLSVLTMRLAVSADSGPTTQASEYKIVKVERRKDFRLEPDDPAPMYTAKPGKTLVLITVECSARLAAEDCDARDTADAQHDCVFLRQDIQPGGNPANTQTLIFSMPDTLKLKTVTVRGLKKDLSSFPAATQATTAPAKSQ